ncbi:MAG: hypothetical protein QXD83_04115 [Sulfolobales archaeon]
MFAHDLDIKRKIDEFDRLWAEAASEMSWCHGGSRPPDFVKVVRSCVRAFELYREIENYFRGKGLDVPETVRMKHEHLKTMYHFASRGRCGW